MKELWLQSRRWITRTHVEPTQAGQQRVYLEWIHSHRVQTQAKLCGFKVVYKGEITRRKKGNHYHKSQLVAAFRVGGIDGLGRSWWEVLGATRMLILVWCSCFMLQIHGSVAKNTPTVQETLEMRIWSLDQEGPLEEKMATHSSILAWKNPMGKGAWQVTAQRVTKSWTQLCAHTHLL